MDITPKQEKRIKALADGHYKRALKKGSGGTYTVEEWVQLCSHYNHRCVRCGDQYTLDTLTVDHVIPISRSGTNDILNLQPLCMRCNSIKQARTMDFRQTPFMFPFPKVEKEYPLTIFQKPNRYYLYWKRRLQPTLSLTFIWMVILWPTWLVLAGLLGLLA